MRCPACKKKFMLGIERLQIERGVQSCGTLPLGTGVQDEYFHAFSFEASHASHRCKRSTAVCFIILPFPLKIKPKKITKCGGHAIPSPHFFRGLQSGGVPSDGLPFCFSRYPFLPLVPPRRRKRQTMRRFSATKYNDIKTGGEFLKSAAAGLFSNGLYTKIRCRHSHSLTSSFPQLLCALFWANFR